MTSATEMAPFEAAFRGLRVLVTGHTGFKGGWLSLWLSDIGAQVHGVSLAPATTPNLFDAIDVASLLDHQVLDIRQRDELIAHVRAISPHVIFHLAAQPLVRKSYDAPLETVETNVMGTAYLLEAARQSPATRAIVCVTTDKVYENHDLGAPFRESDRLGGKDPYSSSKAAAELIVASYRQSFFAGKGAAALATARGGNVIGGGDWSDDRLIPDLAKAIASGDDLVIRNPRALRPWQHVFALCHGYLLLAHGLLSDRPTHEGAWNFGPDADETIEVRQLLRLFEAAWRSPNVIERPVAEKQESQALMLDASKARRDLGWNPPWSLDESVRRTAEWYKSYYAEPAQAGALSRSQLRAYRAAMASTASDAS